MKHWIVTVALACAFLTMVLHFARAGGAPVQEAAGEVASGTSFTLSFPANVTQGDQVTIFAACAGHSNTLSVSGLGAAVWTLLESNPAPTDTNSPAADMWQATAPASAGNIIAVAAASTDACAAHAAEWAGTTAVKDGGMANDRDSSWFGGLGNASTTNASDLVVLDVAWKGNAMITGAPIGTTGPLRAYTAMAAVSVGTALSVQPYYFLAWKTASYPAVNGSFSASGDWSALQAALASSSPNPSPTAAAPCAGPTPPGGIMPYVCAQSGASQW